MIFTAGGIPVIFTEAKKVSQQITYQDFSTRPKTVEASIISVRAKYNEPGKSYDGDIIYKQAGEFVATGGLEEIVSAYKAVLVK